MLATGLTTAIDESTIQLIVQRVAAELRDELHEIVAALATQNDAARTHLTVDDVAAVLGVARSTVYAHWREWGGYKLGDGYKSPIRFDVNALPTASAAEQTTYERNPQGTRRATDPRSRHAAHLASHVHHVPGRRRLRPTLRSSPVRARPANDHAGYLRPIDGPPRP
jgi:hypothetical protein